MNTKLLEGIDFIKLRFLQIHREIKILHLCGIAIAILLLGNSSILLFSFVS